MALGVSFKPPCHPQNLLRAKSCLEIYLIFGEEDVIKEQGLAFAGYPIFYFVGPQAFAGFLQVE
ncbi:MAG: hypothetical protein EA401_14730 [Planctomycetota bacterium]|nr:MAG: hypothetical protein EA401_14730 [Planctomycetota bacterium]